MSRRPVDDIYDERVGNIRDLFVDNGFSVGLTGIKQFYHATRGVPTDPGRFRNVWFSIRCKGEASYRRETSKYEFGIDLPDIDGLESFVSNADIEIYIFIIVANEDRIYVTTNKMVHRLGRMHRDDKNFPNGIYFIERGRCQTFVEFKTWFAGFIVDTAPTVPKCDLPTESHEPPIGYRVFTHPHDTGKLIEFLNDSAYTVTEKYVPDNTTIYCFYELRERIAEEQRTELTRCIAKAKVIKESPTFPAYKELKNNTAREIFLLHYYDVWSKDVDKVIELLKDEMSGIVSTPTTSTVKR